MCECVVHECVGRVMKKLVSKKKEMSSYFLFSSSEL